MTKDEEPKYFLPKVVYEMVKMREDGDLDPDDYDPDGVFEIGVIFDPSVPNSDDPDDPDIGAMFDPDDDDFCPRCGGDGYIEYFDADELRGEDCPGEKNHLVDCPECAGRGFMTEDDTIGNFDCLMPDYDPANFHKYLERKYGRNIADAYSIFGVSERAFRKSIQQQRAAKLEESQDDSHKTT